LLGEHHLCIVENARRVIQADLRSAKELWSWKPRRPTTLTGEPPHLFGDRDALFLLVSRNLGYELERLNPTTGDHVWADGVGLGNRPPNPEAIVANKKAVYLACGGTVTALALSDGKLLWNNPLGVTAPRWRLARTANCLVAWPLEMDLGLGWGWLAAGDLPVAAPLKARLGQPFPVLLIDPGDGKVVQRLSFESALPEGTVQLFAGHMVVGVPGKAWGLSAPDGK
jgi:hypothetical protein